MVKGASLTKKYKLMVLFLIIVFLTLAFGLMLVFINRKVKQETLRDVVGVYEITTSNYIPLNQYYANTNFYINNKEGFIGFCWSLHGDVYPEGNDYLALTFYGKTVYLNCNITLTYIRIYR